MIANPWILKNKNKNKKPNIRDYKLSKQIKKPQIPKIFTFLFLILALFFSLNSCSPPLSFFLSTPIVRASPRPSFLRSHLFFFFFSFQLTHADVAHTQAESRWIRPYRVKPADSGRNSKRKKKKKKGAKRTVWA